MGILTTLGLIAATTAVSKAASKTASDERKAEERRLELEKAKKIAEQEEITKRTLALEAEKTRRQIAMQEAAKQRMQLEQEAARQRQIENQQAIERHRQEIATIRQMRVDHPINYTCPRCTALRTVDRRAGKITCEYCSYKQPLESFHTFVPELDSITTTQSTPNSNSANYKTKSTSVTKSKTSMNIWALLSVIFSLIALLTCGAFIIPEVLGVTFGIIPLCQSSEKRSVFDLVLAIAGIVVGAMTFLLIVLIMISPSSDNSSSSTVVETTTSVLHILGR